MSLLARENIGQLLELNGEIVEAGDLQRIAGTVLHQCKKCSKIYDKRPVSCYYKTDEGDCGSVDFRKRAAKGSMSDKRILKLATEDKTAVKVVLLNELAVGYSLKDGAEAKVTGVVKYEEIEKTENSFDIYLEVTKIEERQEPAVELTEDATKEVTFSDVSTILSSTVKRDEETKVMVFNGMLLAQTNNDQLNIALQSDSSTGKSYIPLQVGEYFPEKDIIMLAGASPTSFFHDRGEYDEKRKVTYVNLEGKILIFTDQPHFLLLEKLRSFLAHDRKELVFKITDKSKSGSNRTKTIVLRGFASIVFCTANFESDEQEKTRLVFLSASSDEDKLKESLLLLTKSESDRQKFKAELEEDAGRKWLRDRVKAVRQSNIREVIIPEAEELIYKRFMTTRKHLVPRHQRDYKRLFATIKAHALLNCFKRERVGADTIVATKADIDAGFELYDKIAESNEMGVSPHVHNVFEKVIKPLVGSLPGKCARREQVTQEYRTVFHKYIAPDSLHKIIKQLEGAGMIVQMPDPEDKRTKLIAIQWGASIEEQTSEQPEKNTPHKKAVNADPTPCIQCGELFESNIDYATHCVARHRRDTT